MIKSVIAVFFLLLFAGCSMTQPTYNTQTAEKAFDEEDTYIMYALLAEEQQQYLAAAGFYELLYHYAKKEEYKSRELASYSAARDYQGLLSHSSAYANAEPRDTIAHRFEILALMALERYDEAKVKALSLVERTKASEDYLLVSDIYIKQQHYDTAIKYLERAYTINYDEAILDQMSVILYLNLGRQADAIAYLESHSRLHGCSKTVCGRLAGFYSQQNNIEGMLTTYKRLYEVDPDPVVGDAIVKIYSYQKDFPHLLEFLEAHPINDPVLLQLYINQKNYPKAAKLARKLYDREGEVAYLGQSAIFTYEGASDKQDAPMLQQVMKDLKLVVTQMPTPLYLNYLGYLMIDHDLDVKEGMGYVKRALEAEPDSAFYLDSLAWGHYRLHECVKAKKLMEKVVEKIGKEDIEVKAHLDAIDACLKNNSKKEHSK